MINRLFIAMGMMAALAIGCNAEKPTAQVKPAGETASASTAIDIPDSYTGDFNPTGLTVGLNPGDLAPEIEGKDLDGTPFKLSDYRGKVVMLDFWGDW